MKEYAEEIIDKNRYGGWLSRQLNFLDFLNLPKHIVSIEFIKGLIPKVEIRYEIWNGDIPNIIQDETGGSRIESRRSVYEIHIKNIYTKGRLKFDDKSCIDHKYTKRRVP